jgi:hypothetical protein
MKREKSSKILEEGREVLEETFSGLCDLNTVR